VDVSAVEKYETRTLSTLGSNHPVTYWKNGSFSCIAAKAINLAMFLLLLHEVADAN
jgi:hypothetical protein